MQDAGQTKAAIIGNNNFDFEKEAFRAFELGLHAVDPSFEWTYVATGELQRRRRGDRGVQQPSTTRVLGAVYPYLGGAHEAVVRLANEKGDVITMSAGSSKACDRTDLDYDIAVKFDAGDYVRHDPGRDPGRRAAAR